MRQLISAAFMATAILLGIQAMEAHAQVACCRILANGVPIGAESFRCNLSGLETRSLQAILGAGSYEVDFTPVSTDVRQFVKLATLDTQAGGDFAGEIGVADRVGDTSSVFVRIRNNAGAGINAGFNLCLY